MTPISSPRFSKQKTCSTPGSSPRATLRSIQASITVRTRAGGSDANAASWSDVKHTTSHRPWPGLVANSVSGVGWPAGSPVPASDGKRFSNTTTS